jgi:hypothetical protein
MTKTEVKKYNKLVAEGSLSGIEFGTPNRKDMLVLFLDESNRVYFEDQNKKIKLFLNAKKIKEIKNLIKKTS